MYSTTCMTETFSLDIEMPEFLELIDAQAREHILEEVSDRIRAQVTELFERTAKEIVVQKMNLFPNEFTRKEEEKEVKEVEEVKEDVKVKMLDVKTSLAEEIMSLPEKDALQRLRLALAQGEIEEETYDELKALVEPVTDGPASTPAAVVTCPKCGKELEPTVHFCRFCGAQLT